MEKNQAPEKQTKKISKQKNENNISLYPKKHTDVDALIDAIQAAGLDEFMEYIGSPWKMIWLNFIAGVARGFGALVGVTIVITLIGWILSGIIDLPLIGKKLQPYVELVESEFKKYTESTNYRDNFERMEKTLESIDSSLKK